MELPAGTLDWPCLSGTSATHNYHENGSRIPAKFVVEPQDAQSRGLCAWDCEPASGSVDAQGSLELTFTVAERLGLINLPATITTVVAVQTPMQLLIRHCVDPRSGSRRNRTTPSGSPSLGKVPVLRDESKVIYVADSCGYSSLLCRTPTAHFSWTPGRRPLEPGEEYALTVTVHMDQPVHRDELNVMVEGAPL